jgi:hypothetical protein
VYEELEGFARAKIRKHLQDLLEEEVTEWLGRAKGERKQNVSEQPKYRNGKARRFAAEIHPALTHAKNLPAPVRFTSGFGTAFPLMRVMDSGSIPNPRANLCICSRALSATPRQGLTIG